MEGVRVAQGCGIEPDLFWLTIGTTAALRW